MDFYSNKHPNLIGPVMKSTISTIVKKPTVNNTVSDKIATFVGGMYQDYIVDNKLVIIFLILLTVFLVYRYYNKPQSTDKDKKEPFSNKEKNLLRDIEEYQLNQLQHESPPSMNPLDSTADDKDLIYYPPDPLPVNIPGSGIVYTRDIYPRQQTTPPFNHVNYDHNNVYENSSRSYYAGSYDTYKNAKDTDIINPFGWSNNFNTNTGAFVSPMTNKNNQVLMNYQAQWDNTNNNLVNGLTNGPTMYGLDPPYSDD
jgi:hypothetical protein